MTHGGSLSGYFRRGCRCENCRAVAAEWRRSRLAALSPGELRARMDRKNELARHRRAVKRNEWK